MNAYKIKEMQIWSLSSILNAKVENTDITITMVVAKKWPQRCLSLQIFSKTYVTGFMETVPNRIGSYEIIGLKDFNTP